MQMLPEGVARRIIEDQTGLVETANVGHTHRVAIDGGFCPGDSTVEFIVERMVTTPIRVWAALVRAIVTLEKFCPRM